MALAATPFSIDRPHHTGNDTPPNTPERTRGRYFQEFALTRVLVVSLGSIFKHSSALLILTASRLKGPRHGAFPVLWHFIPNIQARHIPEQNPSKCRSSSPTSPCRSSAPEHIATRRHRHSAYEWGRTGEPGSMCTLRTASERHRRATSRGSTYKQKPSLRTGVFSCLSQRWHSFCHRSGRS